MCVFLSNPSDLLMKGFQTLGDVPSCKRHQGPSISDLSFNISVNRVEPSSVLHTNFYFEKRILGKGEFLNFIESHRLSRRSWYSLTSTMMEFICVY